MVAAARRQGGIRMRRHKAFTLVELLVVIAVISLLVAILVPTLGQARQLTLSTWCKANLSCQGVALQMYVTEHGYYPGHADSGPVAVWPPRMRQYAESMDIFWCPASPWGFRWQKTFGTPGGVYATQDQADKWGYELGEKMLSILTVPFTYGYNDWGRWEGSTTQRGLGGDLSVVPQVRASQVLNPREMIAIGDNTCDSSWDFNIDPRVSGSSQYPGKIHFEGANILFCDGHVKWYTQAELIDVSPNSGSAGTTAQEAMTKLWNNHNQWGL
ncbi:MAG: type II secretion system protein [Phycisphaerae bacterium]|nr:type II secretion system protein [Phycisphaerae bacterium]